MGCNDNKKSKISGGNKIDQTQSDSFLSAKIDGKQFFTNELFCNLLLDPNTISLTATSNDKIETFRFTIIYDNGPAIYTVGENSNKSGNLIYTHNKDHWIASKKRGEGTITLTEKGNYLIGQFSFDGDSSNSTKQITDGKFKVKMKK
jgi:hypothetical protein